MKKQLTCLLSIILLLSLILPKEKGNEVKIEEKVEEKQLIVVTATVYNPVKSQCNSDPLTTADNNKINLKKLKNEEIKWIAVSRDLLLAENFSYGDRVRLTGHPEIDGIYEIHDTMNKRWKKRIDILKHPDNNPGRGKWENIIIEKL